MLGTQTAGLFQTLAQCLASPVPAHLQIVAINAQALGHLCRVASGENPLVVWGDGSTIRDFIYSRDCAEGMLLALENGANCTPINLGSGVPTTVKDVVESVTAAFDDPPEVTWDTTKPSGQPIRLMDVSRAKDMIGFTAGTSIQQGVKETVDWYLEHHGDAGARYSVFQQERYIT